MASIGKKLPHLECCPGLDKSEEAKGDLSGRETVSIPPISGESYDRAYKMFGAQYQVLAEIYAIVILMNILPKPADVSLAYMGDSYSNCFTIADVGGGTGTTIKRVRGILRRCLSPFYFTRATIPDYLLVEPSQEMAVEAIKKRAVRCEEVVLDDAAGFSKRDDCGAFNVVILQQMIHHVKDWGRFFEDLYSKLKPGGLIMIDTRPLIATFPFGRNAVRSWRESYLSSLPPESILPIGKRLGAKVEFQIIKFDLTMAKKDWIRLCYGTESGFDLFSNITSLTEDEKEEDIAFIEKNYPDILSWKDSHLLIFMQKPGSTGHQIGNIFPSTRAKL